MQMSRVLLKVFRLSPTALLPTKSHEAAGWDLYSDEEVEIYPQSRHPISTGLVVFPRFPWYFLKVEGRSGLAVNHGLFCPCGVIDPDYRGELKAVLANSGSAPVLIKKGQKIAQFLVLPLLESSLVEIPSLEKETPTERGSKGFGSSG
jgi:dUTP pyrophosphatase